MSDEHADRIAAALERIAKAQERQVQVLETMAGLREIIAPPGGIADVYGIENSLDRIARALEKKREGKA